jgi:hypothetical protein
VLNSAQGDARMDIKKWKKNGGGMMVRVNRQEAMRIILSLTQQIISGNCNNDREEFYTGKEYFSIAVHEPKTLDSKILRRGLVDALKVIDGLSNQQAMPDDWYVPIVKQLQELIR